MKKRSAITIRRPTPSDLAKIAEHMRNEPASPWDPFSKLGRIKKLPQEGLLIAESVSQYAGFVYWYRGENPGFDPAVKRYAFIQELQVLEKFRRQRIGTRLLEHALRQMIEKGIEASYLNTRESNKPARELYEKIGFKPHQRTIKYKLKLIS